MKFAYASMMQALSICRAKVVSIVDDLVFKLNISSQHFNGSLIKPSLIQKYRNTERVCG